MWLWEAPWGELFTKRFWIGQGSHAGVLRDPTAAMRLHPAETIQGAAIPLLIYGGAAAAGAAGTALAAGGAKVAAVGTGTALKGVAAWELWQLWDLGQEAARTGLRRWEHAPYAGGPLPTVSPVLPPAAPARRGHGPRRRLPVSRGVTPTAAAPVAETRGVMPQLDNWQRALLGSGAELAGLLRGR